MLNEMLSSTSHLEALYIGRRILERVSELDAPCVCVTFMDELASLG